MHRLGVPFGVSFTRAFPLKSDSFFIVAVVFFLFLQCRVLLLIVIPPPDKGKETKTTRMEIKGIQANQKMLLPTEKSELFSQLYILMLDTKLIKMQLLTA